MRTLMKNKMFIVFKFHGILKSSELIRYLNSISESIINIPVTYPRTRYNKTENAAAFSRRIQFYRAGE